MRKKIKLTRAERKIIKEKVLTAPTFEAALEATPPSVLHKLFDLCGGMEDPQPMSSLWPDDLELAELERRNVEAWRNATEEERNQANPPSV